MLNKAIERIAAGRSPRFGRFVAAKDAYESFLADLQVPFDRMTPEDHARARSDPRLDEAELGFREAMRLSRGEDVPSDTAVAAYQLGLVLHARGRLDEAARLIRESFNVTAALANRDLAGHLSGCHYHLGIVALKQGRLDEAVRHLHRSRRIDEALADLRGTAMCDQALRTCEEAGAEITPGPAPAMPAPIDPDAERIMSETTEPASSAGSEVTSSPPPVRDEPDFAEYSRRELIVLASFSAEPNDLLMARLDALGPEFGRPVSVSRVAFGSPDPAQRGLHPSEPDQHVCATILVLERAGLNGPAFQQLAWASIRTAGEQADFRLFVYLHDLTVDELRELSGDLPFAAALFDTTQIAPIPTLAQLRATLVPFVRNVERLRTSVTWRKAQLRLASASGSLTRGVFLAAAAVALLGWPVRLLQPELAWLGPQAPALASLVFGVLAFPVQSPLLFLIVRGRRAILLASRDSAALMRWVLLGALVLVGAGHLREHLDGSVAWLLLGLVAGVLLDAIQRGGWQAQRRRIDLGILAEAASSPNAVYSARKSLHADSLNPFTCPLLPAITSRAFISYSPSSARGAALAEALYRELSERGAAPFLDRASIPAGANWRQQLERHLSEAEVVVCIVDERSARSGWVAAELVGALEARELTGAPHVVVLIDPAAEERSGELLPIFQEVISRVDDPPLRSRPQIVRLDRETRSALAWSLAPGNYEPTAVLTRETAVPVMLVAGALAVVASLSLPAGLGLGLLAMLETMSDFPMTEKLIDSGWLIPVALLTALWLGSNARATIAWGYERSAAARGMGTVLPVTATIGLVYTSVLLLRRLPVYAALWAIVLIVAGWMTVTLASRERKDVLQ